MSNSPYSSPRDRDLGFRGKSWKQILNLFNTVKLLNYNFVGMDFCALSNNWYQFVPDWIFMRSKCRIPHFCLKCWLWFTAHTIILQKIHLCFYIDKDNPHSFANLDNLVGSSFLVQPGHGSLQCPPADCFSGLGVSDDHHRMAGTLGLVQLNDLCQCIAVDLEALDL